MTLGHDFSERSEREIISKEKGAQNQRITKAKQISSILLAVRYFYLTPLKT